jgi:chemotaxis protein MotB
MKAVAPVIVIRKKRAAHHPHHGGAWKVAYADFVTAMMAFFLVMWLAGSDQKIKENVAGYFRNPGVLDYSRSDGPIDGGRVGVEAGRAPQPIPPQEPSVLAQERAQLTKAAEAIREKLLNATGLDKLRDQIELTVTAEGLRIELVERTGSSFFDSGSAALRGEAESILRIIAGELQPLPNELLIEGHTDQQPYASGAHYGNWELSSDRANAARRVVAQTNIPTNRIQGVRGFADTRLHIKDDPLDPRNRRISLVVRSQAAVALEESITGAARPVAEPAKPAEAVKPPEPHKH